MIYSKDTTETLYHFDDNREFMHEAPMMIRKHTGLPAKCSLVRVPDHNLNERCYFIDGQWVKTTLFIGQVFWDEKAQPEAIGSYPQDMPELYSLLPPPKANKGYVVRLIDEDWVQVDDHRGKMMYDKTDCTHSELIIDAGQVKQGFTLSEPKTEWDEWIDEQWMTNLQNQYIAEYDRVDATRESLYQQMIDPLEGEAARKARQGKADEAQMFYDRIDELEIKIKTENPFPNASTV